MKNNYFKKREKNAHEGDRIGLRGRRNMTEQLNAATENNDPSAPWAIIRLDADNQCLNTMKMILGAVAYKRLDLQVDLVPTPSIAASGACEMERAEALWLSHGKY
ncbi:hypothetical protein [endosymbiont of Lamellibrachia barhami]|uniref:hypothetical protein n=1 Tax=endosymbiont of Lamellibrachia barhami TaxID=205975 RepID=UPI0015AB9E3C|nr:hypothetical protein [endosymbiont of Lamellibrachia barhami]